MVSKLSPSSAGVRRLTGRGNDTPVNNTFNLDQRESSSGASVRLPAGAKWLIAQAWRNASAFSAT